MFFNSIYNNNIFKSIIIIVTKVFITSNIKTTITFINNKDIIIIKIIISRTSIIFSFLFSIN